MKTYTVYVAGMQETIKIQADSVKFNQQSDTWNFTIGGEQVAVLARNSFLGFTAQDA